MKLRSSEKQGVPSKRILFLVACVVVAVLVVILQPQTTALYKAHGEPAYPDPGLHPGGSYPPDEKTSSFEEKTEADLRENSSNVVSFTETSHGENGVHGGSDEETRRRDSGVARGGIGQGQGVRSSQYVTGNERVNNNAKSRTWQFSKPASLEQVLDSAKKTVQKNDSKNKKSQQKDLSVCQVPFVDPFDPSAAYLIEKFPPLDCSGGLPSVVRLDGDMLVVDAEMVKDKLKGKTVKYCQYRTQAMTPGGDYNTSRSEWSEPFVARVDVGADAEHFIVECYGQGGELLAKTYLSAVRVKPSLEQRLHRRYEDHLKTSQAVETLSVMIVGVDGMSRQNVIRTMPETRRFLLDTLKAAEMSNYNKNGMNTFPNVITLVTGKTAKEHSSYWDTSKHFDVMHFVWDDFEQAGYRTQMVLDTVKVTSFHCSKQGFSKPPVHYYNRPTVIASEPDSQVRHKDNNCIGDTPEVTLLTDYQLQMASVFNNSKDRPYFSYSFFVRLSHDNIHKASAGDQLYLNFFKSLHERNLLNNTVLIFFSDHGPRFGPFRRTDVGMLEERMPFCFLVFPAWFMKKYPRVAKAISTNRDRLTSHFDIHATLKDILNFRGQTKPEDPKSRAISLFREIPADRTCQQAGINFQWCSCNKMTSLGADHVMVRLLAFEFAQKLSDQTLSVRKLCHQLNLHAIMSAMMVEPDVARTGGDVTLYQLTIETMPGGAVFEGMLEFSRVTNKTEIVGTVLRLNMFQPQSECVESPSLKPFCYCKDLDS